MNEVFSLTSRLCSAPVSSCTTNAIREWCYLLTGNGNKLVSTLVPKETIPAIEILIKKENRVADGVANENQFIFPSTHSSGMHCHGWHAINTVCQQAGISSESINATKQRGRISTLYASCDVPPEKRHLFFQHMGHNPEVNIGSYQRPLALETISHVGKVLQSLDSGMVQLPGTCIMLYYLWFLGERESISHVTEPDLKDSDCSPGMESVSRYL